MAKSMEEIASLLQNTKFKKTLIGGIKPSDMWAKLERLQQEYEEVVKEENIRHEALLKEREEEILQLQKQLARQGDGHVS